MVRLARMLGCTEGQAYTIAIGVVVTLVAAIVGLPPTLRDVGRTTDLSPTVDYADAPTGMEGTDESPDPAVPDIATPTPVAPDPGESAAPTADVVADGQGPSPRGNTTPPTTDTPAQLSAPARFGSVTLASEVGEPGAPDGVAVDEDGRVHVATNNGLVRGGAGASSVFRYAPDGSLDVDLEVQGQDAARSGGLTGLQIAPDGRVLVLDTSPARVLTLDLDAGRQATHAILDDLPPCSPAAADPCESGVDGQPEPRAMARDDTGRLLVTDSGQGVIWTVSPAGTAEPWFRLPDEETVAGPTGIVLDDDGDVLVAVSMVLDGSPAGGELLRIEVDDDGSAGRSSSVATTGPLSNPVGLATTPGGGIVVALAGSDEVLLLGPDGAERDRMSAEEVGDSTGVPLDGPTGVAVDGTSVFVTNQSPTTNTASHWVVFEMPLVDEETGS